MLMFSEQFLEKDSFEIDYNGKKVFAFYSFEKKGKHSLHFTFINTFSHYKQAIIVHLDSFKGNIFIDGREIKKPKGRFPQLLFDEESTPGQFTIDVVLESGNLVICNGSDPLGTGEIWHTITKGCAMIIEPIDENHLRFYCNDHENDDDFDDLIFDLEFLKTD